MIDPMVRTEVIRLPLHDRNNDSFLIRKVRVVQHITGNFFPSYKAFGTFLPIANEYE